MADFEIEVPITVKGGREGERVGKQIGDKIAGSIEKAFRAIGITRKGGGGGDGGGGVEAMAGISKSLKGAALKLGAIAAATAVLIGIMKKSSPYLQGILSIFGRAFTIFFRPFGDFLATLLRPLAIWLMKMAVAFLKWTRTGAGGTSVAGATGAAGGALAGAAIGSVVPGIGTAIGAAAGAAIGLIVGLLTQVNWEAVGTAIKDFAEGVLSAFKNFVEDPVGFLIGVGIELKDALGRFRDIINDAWTRFVDWLGNALPMFSEWLGLKLGEGLRFIAQKIIEFGPWLWERLTTTFYTVLEILKGIGQWLWDTMTNFMRDPIGTLKGIGQWLWDTITGALSNIWSKLSGIGSWIFNTITSSISSFLGGFTRGIRGYATGTPFVPETGLYQLHRGEQVVPRNQASGRTVIFRPTFNVSSNGVTQDIDMDAIARRFGRMTEMEMKKRGIL